MIYTHYVFITYIDNLYNSYNIKMYCYIIIIYLHQKLDKRVTNKCKKCKNLPYQTIFNAIYKQQCITIYLFNIYNLYNIIKYNINIDINISI